MPANVVQPGQEKYWERAKAQAAKEGHAEDWPYIMGTFKRMTLNKSMVDRPIYGGVAQMARRYILPGGVPSNQQRALMQLAAAKPQRQPVTPDKLWADRPVLRLSKIVDNVGLDIGQQRDYERTLSDLIPSPNEAILRAQLLVKMRHDNLDPIQRREILSRALSYQRTA